MVKLVNPHEHAARERKVARMLAAVPLVTTPNERETMALVLEQSDGSARKLFAAKLGVNEPSKETWTALCAAVRARPLATEAEVKQGRSAWENAT